MHSQKRYSNPKKLKYHELSGEDYEMDYHLLEKGIEPQELIEGVWKSFQSRSWEPEGVYRAQLPDDIYYCDKCEEYFISRGGRRPCPDCNRDSTLDEEIKSRARDAAEIRDRYGETLSGHDLAEKLQELSDELMEYCTELNDRILKGEGDIHTFMVGAQLQSHAQMDAHRASQLREDS